MTITFESASDLARGLLRAEGAHGQHQEESGESEPNWPGWYARYLEARSSGREPAEADNPLQAAYASAAELEAAVLRAGQAHGRHEERTGLADADWPSWYAEHMAREQPSVKGTPT